MMSTDILTGPTTLFRRPSVPRCRRLHATAPLAMLPTAVLAQTAGSEVPPFGSAALLQMTLALALVVALLFLGAWLLRRINGGRGFGNGGPLRLVGGLVIGPRERIVLVEVDDTWIVVGIAPGQMRTLHTLPKGDLRTGGDGEKHFAQWLKRISERRNEDG